MPDYPTCSQPGCGQPIHDQAYICATCTTALAKDLRDVAALAGEAAATIYGLDNVARPAGPGQPDPDRYTPPVVRPLLRPSRYLPARGEPAGALRPSGLPVRIETAQAYDAAVLELHTWARHITEQTGRNMTNEGVA
jgi:hypothetical protein